MLFCTHHAFELLIVMIFKLHCGPVPRGNIINFPTLPTLSHLDNFPNFPSLWLAKLKLKAIFILLRSLVWPLLILPKTDFEFPVSSPEKNSMSKTAKNAHGYWINLLRSICCWTYTIWKERLFYVFSGPDFRSYRLRYFFPFELAIILPCFVMQWPLMTSWNCTH